MQRNRTIILDADEVLYECNSPALEYVNQRHGTDFSLEDITHWGKIGSVIDERIDLYYDPDFVLNQPLINGAKDFVCELQKRADVLIATSVPATCAGARVSAIIRDFPNIPQENILIGSRKDKIAADFILDDAWHNIQNSIARYPVLLRKPWNKSITGCISVSNYEEFLTLVDLTERPAYGKATPPYVLAIIGPSGCGKTYLADELVKTGEFVRATSSTTRQKRTEESDDAYHFMSEEEFISRREQKLFFETSSYMGQYYGLQKKDVNDILSSGKNALVVVEINGAIAMKSAFGENAIIAFVERNKESCIRSILQRRLPIEESVRRISSIDAEIRNRQFADIVVKSGDAKLLVDYILK